LALFRLPAQKIERLALYVDDFHSGRGRAAQRNRRDNRPDEIGGQGQMGHFELKALIPLLRGEGFELMPCPANTSGTQER